MRTIKFRAWDTKKQMMTGLPFAIVSQSDNYLLVKDYSTNGFWVPEKTSRLIPMQYTGLTDKNGKEIFEGDIYLPRDGVKRIIEFKDGCFAEKNSFPTFRIELGGEVIGNIYENPELLKGTYG